MSEQLESGLNPMSEQPDRSGHNGHTGQHHGELTDHHVVHQAENSAQVCNNEGNIIIDQTDVVKDIQTNDQDPLAENWEADNGVVETVITDREEAPLHDDELAERIERHNPTNGGHIELARESIQRAIAEIGEKGDDDREKYREIRDQQISLAEMQHNDVDIPTIILELRMAKSLPVEQAATGINDQNDNMDRAASNPVEYLPRNQYQEIESTDHLRDTLVQVAQNFEWNAENQKHRPDEYGRKYEFGRFRRDQDTTMIDKFIEASDYTHYSPELCVDYMMYLTTVHNLDPKGGPADWTKKSDKNTGYKTLTSCIKPDQIVRNGVGWIPFRFTHARRGSKYGGSGSREEAIKDYRQVWDDAEGARQRSLGGLQQTKNRINDDYKRSLKEALKRLSNDARGIRESISIDP